MFQNLILSLLVFCNSNAFATDCSINGYSVLKNQKYTSLIANGQLAFNGLEVKEFLIVNGSLSGDNLKCQLLKINGSCKLHDCQCQSIKSNGEFEGSQICVSVLAAFNGSLDATQSQFSQLTIASTNATLTDSVVDKNIEVKKVNNEWSFFDWFCKQEKPVQVLELKGKSIVNGDVIFDQFGEVHLFDDAKIIGQVVNAKVCLKNEISF